jgi:hypothetical protein
MHSTTLSLCLAGHVTSDRELSQFNCLCHVVLGKLATVGTKALLTVLATPCEHLQSAGLFWPVRCDIVTTLHRWCTWVALLSGVRLGGCVPGLVLSGVVTQNECKLLMYIVNT